LLGILATDAGARFAVPVDGPVPFRRDRLSLDAEAMTDLSKQLNVLACSIDPHTPRHRRGAAQLLALAVALDPLNADATTSLATLAQNGSPPRPAQETIDQAVNRVMSTLRWLDRNDAGDDARALAACLMDVMLVVDPQNVLLQLSAGNGERGAWKSWIPEISAYETKPGPLSRRSPERPPEPEPPPPSPAANKPMRTEIRTVLWQQKQSGGVTQWLLQPASIELRSSQLPSPSDPASLIIDTPAASAAYGNDLRALVAPVLRERAPLLRGWRFRITSKTLEHSLGSNKPQFPQAALAVLTASALKSTKTNAIVLGRFDEQGAFRQPPMMWDQLRALGKANRQRLVLPAECEALALSWLAWEKPEFFVHYEVMLAADLDEACRFAAEQEPDQATAEALRRFEQFCTASIGKSLRTFIVNPNVKRSLNDIARQLPHHLSAKALLQQADSNRPASLHRLALTSELRRITEPVEWIVKLQEPLNIPLDRPKISDVHDECRRNLDALEKYVSKNDLSLLRSAIKTTDAVRGLDRAISIKSRDDLAERLPRIMAAKRHLEVTHIEFLQDLRSADPEAFR
jgi:hypothetical protein